MMRKSMIIAVAWLVTSVVLWQCSTRKDKQVSFEPAFHPDIAAFTAGVISSGSDITIELADAYDGYVEAMTPVGQKLFDFSPRIRGEAYWLNARTIVFRPDQRLPNGQVYLATFHLGRLKEVPRDMARFVFSFQTIAKSFVVEPGGMEAIDPDDGIWNRFTGLLVTSDYMDSEEAGQLLKAFQGARPLSISWEPNSQGTHHAFSIDSLQRKNEKEYLRLVWDGKPAGVQISDERIIDIPAIGDFSVMDTRVVQHPEQHVVVRFSDPLAGNQSLQGLVTIDGSDNLRYRTERNSLLIYPSARLTGSYTLTISEGLMSRPGYRFVQTKRMEVLFEDIKPAVRLTGRGVILPDSDGLIFPFEAVNLRAVDLRIIKVFENNIGQFLQVNRLDGDAELKRAGRLVLQRTIQLTSERPVDYSSWNSFSFDLSRLVRSEPGAIYRVEIGFKREHALYPCGEEAAADHLTQMSLLPDELEEAMAYWDDPDMYWDPYAAYSWWDPWYDWEERDNPCHDAYYGRQRTVARNVLASNLGILAKGANDQSMLFAVTDLRTAAPLPGVTLDVYNYQNQLIGSVSTGSDGMARINPDMKPYLLVARLDKQRGYLRLDDGSSLSVSRFDTEGAVIHRGIKGLIYTDRGVWRPGDSLYIVFMLEDRLKQLPAGHPVSFELYNPAGQLVERRQRVSGMNGFYNFSTATSHDAPTGNWRAQVRVGGSSFSRILKVETVMPNRIKIDLRFELDRLGSLDTGQPGQLALSWLHGTPARNLRVHVGVTLNKSVTRFAGYEGYIFDDPTRLFDTDEAVLFDGKVDGQGRATILPRMASAPTAPGMLLAHFVVRAFEESGAFSIDRFSHPYSPFPYYVGIRPPESEHTFGILYNDTDHTLEVVTLDREGRPVSRNGLEVNISRLEWRWWWDAASENLASYMGSSYPSPVFSQRLSTANGRGSFQFRIPHPEWGRYLVRVSDPSGGHSTAAVLYVDWPGQASRAAAADPQAAAMLSIATDKTTYQVGEQVQVSLPDIKQGRALVSLETGNKIINSWWQEARDGEIRFQFPVTAAMSPNVYLHVSLLQPHAQAGSDLPIRMYGIVPLMVEDPATRLSPLIDMPETLEPEQQASIRISEADGKRMTYTIAIVDEGLLDLTRFRTPDPWNAFFAREALGVRTWDVYDQVIGAYGGRIEQVFSIGGDEAIVGQLQPQANRFRPMVSFLGPFTLERGRTNTHQVDIPSYIGSVRAMVVAGDQGAYGSAEKTVAVKKPLMVLATLPRVLRPGERFALPVTLFAMDESISEVDVRVTANELFDVTGPANRTVRFDAAGDQVISFDLEVRQSTGLGRVRVDVSSAGHRATDDTEIDISNPNPFTVSLYEGTAEPGGEWLETYRPVGVAGTNEVFLELSVIPPVDLSRRLRYLMTYPHGCLEQIASAAFPQLYVDRIMEVDDAMASRFDTNIREAIRLIASYQRHDGGIRYWPGGADVSSWGTSYAGHFMLEASAKGYALPVRFLGNWISYQRSQARSWSPAQQRPGRFGSHHHDDLLQAYRLYTLALANSPELGAMNRLRETGGLSLQARWRLAAAYVLAGQPEAAERLVQNHDWQMEDYPAFNASYGSAERDMAMILETLILLNKQQEAIPLVKKMAEALSGQGWMSTQTTAYCLMAISAYYMQHAGEGGVSAVCSIGDQREIAVSTEKAIIQIPWDADKDRETSVRVTNTGSGVLFARLVAGGIPALEEVVASENQLQLSASYYDMNGNRIEESSLLQGTDFYAEVTIRNPGRLGPYTDMVLSQVFPSGWEIRNVRMDETAAARQASSPSYQDFRDDRVHTHFDIGAGQTKRFVVMLHAAYQGRFYLPGTFCEAMYDHTIYARQAGRWVEVVDGR